MAPLPKRKHSKQRRDKRRSQDGLKLPTLVKDLETGKLIRPHTVSRFTGKYNTEEVIKVK
jgi:ribosomal protein L32